MRTHAILALAATLFAANAAPAADVRKGDPAPPAQAAPAPAQKQPGVDPGFAPGVPLPGQPQNQPDLQKMQEQMREQMARMMGLRVPPPALKWGGMVLEPADAALLDQLNLPAGHGMVVKTVEADSPSFEAGLKKHDVIVKVNEQAVPTDARKLLKMLGEVKAETPLDLVVVRKGKEQTLKGAKLPEAALATPPGFGPPALGQPGFGGGFAPLPLPPVAPQAGPFGPPAGIGVPGAPGQADLDGATVNIKRENKQFEGTYSKDKLKVTIRGKMDGMQPKLEQVTVQQGEQGEEGKKYQKLNDVPREQRAIVRRMMQMVSGGGIPGVAPPPLLPAQPGAPQAPPAAPEPKQ